MNTELPKLVRTKTVEEVFIEKATIVVFKPPLQGTRCSCFEKDKEPGFLCRECYGTGVVGGFDLRKEVISIQDATYEEIENVTVSLDTTKTDHQFDSIDDWVSLSFECPFQCSIYYGCIFSLDNHYWRVITVSERDSEEEDFEGEYLKTHWEVSARKLQPFEPAYVFLDDKKWKLEEHVNVK